MYIFYDEEKHQVHLILNLQVNKNITPEFIKNPVAPITPIIQWEKRNL